MSSPSSQLRSEPTRDEQMVGASDTTRSRGRWFRKGFAHWLAGAVERMPPLVIARAGWPVSAAATILSLPQLPVFKL